jgi:hypothetical protein
MMAFEFMGGGWLANESGESAGVQGNKKGRG